MYILYTKMETKMVDYDKMMQDIDRGTTMTSVRIANDFFNLAKKHNIKFSDAMRVGIGVLLADQGVKQYDSHLNLYRKMRKYQEIAEDASKQVIEMEKKLAELEGNSNEKQN
ncbi:MAG: hypothetical protein ACOCUD_01635 [Bacillota bacterium]